MNSPRDKYTKGREEVQRGPIALQHEAVKEIGATQEETGAISEAREEETE